MPEERPRKVARLDVDGFFAHPDSTTTYQPELIDEPPAQFASNTK